MTTETKTTHTPGPYHHVRQYATDDSHDVISENGTVVATCGVQACNDGVIAANARLLAASPKLLLSLRRCVLLLEMITTGSDHASRKETTRTIDEANEAIFTAQQSHG
jgi:hypothetical protein